MTNISLDKVDNGYIVTYVCPNTGELKKTVVEEDDGDEHGYVALMQVFWTIQEILGVHNSKHNKTRLVVSVEEQK